MLKVPMCSGTTTERILPRRCLYAPSTSGSLLRNVHGPPTVASNGLLALNLRVCWRATTCYQNQSPLEMQLATMHLVELCLTKQFAVLNTTMPRCPPSRRLEMIAHCCHQKEHTTEAINETHHLPEESVVTRIFPIVSWIHANTCASAMSCVACPIISCWTNSKEQLPWRYRSQQRTGHAKSFTPNATALPCSFAY